MKKRDSLGALTDLETAGGKVAYHRLDRLREAGIADVRRLPYSVKVLLESILRNEDGEIVTAGHAERLARRRPGAGETFELPFMPARVLLQDFTGVPCIVDLAAMRSAIERLGGDPALVDPLVPVDLVVDHSVQVDAFGSRTALGTNTEREFERNRERYEFLHWGQRTFRNLRVIPPGGGICHQVNLEHLASVVQVREIDGRTFALPDSLVGTDSHTTMIDGLGVVGWGVGGIEAEAAMLGRPLHMLAPEVVGVRLSGRLAPGATATDLVLTVTQMLREHGVVGKFVEFCGPGLPTLTVQDRATIANMSPEYGATMGFFPVDGQTLAYLRATGRGEDLVDLVERYTRAQGLYREDGSPDPEFDALLELDLAQVEPSMSGPRRPQDRLALGDVGGSFREALRATRDHGGFEAGDAPETTTGIGHGSVVIAAITSCTNTSNPSVMVAAGLVAKKANERGLTSRPWVKTSLAPGSRAVTRYLDEAGLTPHLEALGFHTVGYGCTTCIGNSGPLPEDVARDVDAHDLVVAAVLSGNRNFEGRIHPQVRASYLASPPLVVAHAIAGRVDIDMTREPLAHDADGRPVLLTDLWPSPEEVAGIVEGATRPGAFLETYDEIEGLNDQWNTIRSTGGELYAWDEESTYIHEPPFFRSMSRSPSPIGPIRGARVLAHLGDSITTDHISPAGAIAPESPAGRWLQDRGVAPAEFNTYGSRRGNDLVMTRGTFANIRLRNLLAPGTEGGWTTHLPSGDRVTIHEAAERYASEATPTIVLAGRDYGMGSSRDWAAKGTLLLGVRAVIARSFERIHRSNLVGMGVLPLELPEDAPDLTARETFDIDLSDDLAPGDPVTVRAVGEDGGTISFEARCRLDSTVEVRYLRHGGILHAVVREMLGGS